MSGDGSRRKELWSFCFQKPVMCSLRIPYMCVMYFDHIHPHSLPTMSPPSFMSFLIYKTWSYNAYNTWLQLVLPIWVKECGTIHWSVGHLPAHATVQTLGQRITCGRQLLLPLRVSGVKLSSSSLHSEYTLPSEPFCWSRFGFLGFFPPLFLKSQSTEDSGS